MAGIYIHIPFCKTRCIYCDFFSSVSIREKEKLVHALCSEFKLRKDYLQGQPIETVYFGGGTPSLLSIKEIEKILSQIPNFHHVKEVTLEANPDDITLDYLRDLISLGFNRISLGVQSFQDKELTFLRRRHNAQAAIEAIENCKIAGFNNISIDLIYGLPGQTMENWTKNLLQALQSEITHISAYHLIYEEGTALNQLLKQGKIQFVDEELSLSMFSRMINLLTTNGFIHYEISNFGKKDLFSLHNSSYWTGKHYLGVGPSAHSYDGISRQWNVSSIKKYLDSIAKGIVPFEKEFIDDRMSYNDYILTGLRTMWGIDLDNISEQFGEKMKIYCLKLAQKYLRSENLEQEGSILKLSRKGLFLSDTIMSDLISIER